MDFWQSNTEVSHLVNYAEINCFIWVKVGWPRDCALNLIITLGNVLCQQVDLHSKIINSDVKLSTWCTTERTM